MGLVGLSADCIVKKKLQRMSGQGKGKLQYEIESKWDQEQHGVISANGEV